MAFTVTEIINGNTIRVSPNWKWGEYGDSYVRIHELSDKAGSDPFARDTLNFLIKDKVIVLKGPIAVVPYEGTSVIIQCSIYLNDVNISQYFPDLIRSKNNK